MNTSNVTFLLSPDEQTNIYLMNVLLAAAYATNLILGFPTNSYVLWLIVKGTREKIASDLFPLNLTVSEIILSLAAILFFLQSHLSPDLFRKLFLFSCGTFFTSRPLFQCYICLEQYLAVVRPVVFLSCKPLRYRVACCGVAWLIVIAVSVMAVVNDLGQEVFLLAAAMYLLFLGLMCFCCFSVLRALKRPAPGQGEKEWQGVNSMKRRAFKILLFNVVYTVVSELPMVVTAFLKGNLPTDLFFVITSGVVCVFVMMGFVPPALYLYRVGKLSSSCKCL